MKEEASEERPTTEQTEGDPTTEPSQNNTSVENEENDTSVTVNTEEVVNGEDNAADETKETDIVTTTGPQESDACSVSVQDTEERDTCSNKVQDTETVEAQTTDANEAPSIDANEAQSNDANEAQQTVAGEAEETNASVVNSEDTTKETANMTTKEADEINANDTEKVNNEASNETADQVDGSPAETSETGDAVEELKSDVTDFPRERRLTAYERLSNDLSGDQKVLKEITLGKRIGFYRIRGELGHGNFSQVKMGIHALTKEKVAVKILDKTKLDQKTQRLLSREISSMDKMHHPNIIRLYEVVETLAKLHIVMEFAGGGELFHKISNEGKIAETEAKIVYSQVLAAIQHMHEKNIIHRDLKAENVFYAGPRFVKIGDFGFSTTCRPDQTLNTFCGSPPYAAPELFKDEHYHGSFVDIWALGILLYFMVCGVMPFRAETVSKLKKCILEGSFVIPSFVSDSCQFLIRGILKPIPHDRFTLAEICRSEWLENQEFPEALPPYNMNPSADGVELTEEELETRAILHDLGIKEDHIKQCHGKDSRSSINGTYRIVLHKVQRKRSGRVIDPGPEFEPETNPEDTKNNKNKRNTKKTSKFCVIL